MRGNYLNCIDGSIIVYIIISISTTMSDLADGGRH